MKFPWDKITRKASDKSKGAEPSPMILDEVGFRRDIDKYVTMAERIKNTVGQPKTMDGKTKYEVKSYPDGSKYVVVHTIATEMVFKINSYEDLWILNQIHDVVKHTGFKVTVTIPNLLDAQADRRFDKNKPHSLKLVCEFLNSMTNFSFRIFHPHNAEVVEALLDRVEIIDNFEFLKNVTLSIYNTEKKSFNSMSIYPVCQNALQNNLILMSSDAGGFKPLMKLADKLNWQGETFSASKSRAYVDGKTKLVQMLDRQDFGGKDILIIDDICVYGGTFKGLAKMLKERNCGRLYLAVSHLTVSNLGEDPVTNYFEKVFTTNSKWDKYETKTEDKNHGTLITPHQPKNLEIIKLF